jgi:hypothetical protein
MRLESPGSRFGRRVARESQPADCQTWSVWARLDYWLLEPVCQGLGGEQSLSGERVELLAVSQWLSARLYSGVESSPVRREGRALVRWRDRRVNPVYVNSACVNSA